MKMLWMLLLQLLPLLLAWPATSATLRADLTHADSGRGFTRRELLRRMVIRSRARAAKLCPSGRHGSPVTAPVVLIHGDDIFTTEYVMHFHIGLQCFPQTLPTLDTSASSTVHGVACSDPLCQSLGTRECFIRGCTYQYKYGDQSIIYGQLAKDSFTFHGKGGTVVSVPDLAFGCGMYTTGKFFSPNESGIAGFSRGPLSLPEQLKVSSFSYCLTSVFLESKGSPVLLGAPGPDDLRAHATGPILSTPFVRNPPEHPKYYYLSLKGITVGKTRLPVPESVFALKADGSGGTFIDSGTSITSFPRAVFQSLREAFVAQVPLPHTAFDQDVQCFFTPDASKVAVPKLILHLEGADWELPRENYMVDYPDRMCLTLLPRDDDDWTIIGNFQQQNMHMVYDLAGNKLVIVPAQCDKM